jgi:hypothetical protein
MADRHRIFLASFDAKAGSMFKFIIAIRVCNFNLCFAIFRSVFSSLGGSSFPQGC